MAAQDDLAAQRLLGDYDDNSDSEKYFWPEFDGHGEPYRKGRNGRVPIGERLRTNSWTQTYGVAVKADFGTWRVFPYMATRRSARSTRRTLVGKS